MQWLNEPARWRAADNLLTATSDAQTDFWRLTHDGGIRDNGHFYFEEVEGDFSASVKISGEYQSQYDQAGLMVRVDERTWLKCGVEWMDGRQYASAVATRDTSDWSIVLLDNPSSLWICCERIGETLTVRYSLDAVQYAMIRQAYLPPCPLLQVGIMLASPKGPGVTIRFEGFAVESR